VSVDRVDADGDGGGEDDPWDGRRVTRDHREPVVADRQTTELDAGRYKARTTIDVEPLRPTAAATADTIDIPARTVGFTDVN